MADNPQLDLAWKFLEQTGTNIFLTGKAGTGKTTFLRNLKQHSPKRMIVVAPTGVAAINAGGVTIHSFFQLPLGPYLPAMQGSEGGQLKMNFNREKVAVIRSLDLLVIDEISMVRADLLDAINEVLQRYRDRTKPFGGVQLLMIGDLQQLAPVVKPQEWELIHTHYDSPYFFDSKALKATDYLTLELQHIYRQNDSKFIDILNRVREGTLNEETLNKLNSRYIANFEAQDHEGYITLTSHNNAAREINERKLQKLKTPTYTFTCNVEGNFPEYLYPNDSELTLKKGAQVMFVKNDISGQHRYFNGKIGHVTALDKSHIEVSLDDQPEPIDVEIAEWSNAKYTIDAQTQEISEVVEGLFRQFPLKLAWAITIHKSQGLTFERAVIDAAASFSHGQVYVALSRCRSFEGLVLSAPLQRHAIINDATIRAYNRNVEDNQPDEAMLSTQSRYYFQSLLLDLFNFIPLRFRLRAVQKVFNDNLARLYPKLTTSWDEAMRGFQSEIVAVSERFQSQITHLVASTPDLQNAPLLTERVTKAQAYFRIKCDQIISPIVDQSNVELDNKETKKMLSDALKRLKEQLTLKTTLLAFDHSAGFTTHNYLDTRAKASLNEPKPKAAKAVKTTPNEKSPKKTPSSTSADIEHPQLFELLRAWRKTITERDNLPAFMVLHQKTLIALCNATPRNIQELQNVSGIGKGFISKHGQQVLAIIAEWAVQHR